MAHYFFPKDLKDSERAVLLVANFLKDKYKADYRLMEKAEQGSGDICININGKGLFVEVKFDIMAAKTGNLCFEVDNGKKLTGILATKSDQTVYVVPRDKNFKLFIFSTPALVAYLTEPLNSAKFKFRRGGDRGRFGMFLVPLSTIEQDNITEEIVEV